MFLLEAYNMKISPTLVSASQINHESRIFNLCVESTQLLLNTLIEKNVGYFIQCFEGDEDTIIKLKCGSTDQFFLLENIKKVIGSQIELILLGFNNNEGIMAKVDTGASFCSLHAKNIRLTPSSYNKDDEQVTFEYNNQEYRMPIVNKQSVQNSDGGITYRPVVKFNVSMSNKTYQDVLFNLNDRSDMTHEILLGQNLLAQSRVLVDPTLYMEGLTFELADPLHEAVDLKKDEKMTEANCDYEKFKHLTLAEILGVLVTFNS